jgi:hypothetical protein
MIFCDSFDCASEEKALESSESVPPVSLPVTQQTTDTNRKKRQERKEKKTQVSNKRNP